jgi:tetratricopeptide (TPR) repeat protein
VLDDVHWADVPTLLLIEHMARVMPETRVLGVGTYRDVELDVSRPLVATLDRLVRARAVERISLSRLDVGGVARMIEALAGREPPQRVVSVVYDETEGNPFFVMEVFRHLAEEGRLFDAAGAFRDDLSVDELDVPESVRLVVGRRLERLGPEAQRALAAGAVVGRGFPFALLEEISDVPAAQLVDIVEEAEAARVVVPEERGGAIHYTFAHELIRQTLLTSLSLLRRQRLHLAVADATERLFPDARETRPSEIAHHLLQAGAAADPARTLDYLERAAERAMASAAFEDALRYVGDALTLVPPDDERRRVQLRLSQGLAVRALGRYDECLAIWDEVVDALVGLGDREEAATLTWSMGYQQLWLNRFDEAFLTYDRGRRIIGDELGPAKAALVGSQGVLAGLAGLHGLYEPSAAMLEEGLEIARELADDREIARASWGRCVLDWAFGQLEPSAEAARRAVEHARRADDPWLLADSLAWLSFPTGCLGLLEECDAAARESLDLALRIGHITAEIVARRGIEISGTAWDPDLGRLDAALQKDLELCRSIDSPWRAQSLAWLSYSATMRGRLDEGLRFAEDAAAVEPVSAFSGFAWAAQLDNRLAAGDLPAARALLAERADELRALEPISSIGAYMSLSVALEAAARIGDVQLCEALYALFEPQVGRCPGRPFDWASDHRIAGMAAAALSRWDDAEAQLTRALERCRAVPVRIEEPRVLHRYGEVLLTRGRAEDLDRAREMVEAAVEGYRRVGMPVLLAEAEQLLRT